MLCSDLTAVEQHHVFTDSSEFHVLLSDSRSSLYSVTQRRARLADIVLWFHSVHTTLKLGGAYVWETLGLTPAATEINFEV